MIGRFCAAAAALVFSAGAAWAAESCSDPIPPVAVNGMTATEQQMQDAISDFKVFQAASDDFQKCILLKLSDQEKAAAKAKNPKPVDPSVIQAVKDKVDANQRLKEKVGGELNAAILAYKSRHPKS
jgi:hypothetical protein